jgi:hypothetical protein
MTDPKPQFDFDFKNDRAILYSDLHLFIQEYIKAQKAKKTCPDYVVYRNFIVVLEGLIKDLRK